jgi:ubiquinone/menaquinone biosynthesis C-methylase UbiE
LDYYDLLIEFHLNSHRLAPGSDDHTMQAFDLTGFSRNEHLKILDIGCGTGAQTLALLHHTNAEITAVDNSISLLVKMEERAVDAGFENRISPLFGNMSEIPLDEATFDLIWAEGSVYNIGFENGLRQFSKFLKPNGMMVISELVWISENRPKEIEDYWNENYPGIGTIIEKEEQISNNGMRLIDSFILPESCWVDNYYEPNSRRTKEFVSKFSSQEGVNDFLAFEKSEYEAYLKYRDYYSYAFFIIQC